MNKTNGLLTFLFLIGVGAIVIGAGVLFAAMPKQAPETDMIALQAQDLTPSPTATETIPPYTPLASLTPSQTLKPPPTFEPPTATPQPTLIPSLTPTATFVTEIDIPGLHGAETPTPTSTQGCEPRSDWQLTYTVQTGDALAKIAEKYGTYTSDLAAGNCITDPNLIQVGQELRVPGEVHPEEAFVCAPWELLTPIDNAFGIPGSGSLTFNWRGPEAARNLVRIYKPDGSFYEEVVDLRQNATIDLSNLPDAGLYTWYVYPLDENFAQIACLEGGPWTFTKDAGPTATPPSAPQPSFITDVNSGTAPLVVQFFNTSRGEVTGYHWDFGDGTSSTDESPTHTYDTAGSYLVRFTAYGPGGEEFSTTLIRVQ